MSLESNSTITLTHFKPSYWWSVSARYLGCRAKKGVHARVYGSLMLSFVRQLPLILIEGDKFFWKTTQTIHRGRRQIRMDDEEGRTTQALTRQDIPKIVQAVLAALNKHPDPSSGSGTSSGAGLSSELSVPKSSH